MSPDRVSWRRALRLCAWSLVVGVLAYFFGRGLLAAIYLINNLMFHGVFSTVDHSQMTGQISLWAALVPAIGGLIIGVIARFGSPAVRGHGIPEVIETVLTQQSRVPWKVAILKPICSAISIGSGGPFGAEGPVIGLGGSLGSLIGQTPSFKAWERKVLLAAGAAAGITAVFGCPVAATLLSLELLLFEFNPLSLTAVGIASACAASLRLGLIGTEAMFPVTALAPSSAWDMAFYVAIGLPLGLVAAGITFAVPAAEESFEHLPIHWMWWPAIGGLVVGALALINPAVLGPGYGAIGDTLAGRLVGGALLTFVLLKGTAWIVALGSGTAGGTLAPIFGIGAGTGALLTVIALHFFPGLPLDPQMGAIVGMAAVFAGAAHAPLASMILAVETTHCLDAALPLLGACLLATLVCHVLLPASLMTEGPKKRGVRFPRGARRRA